MWVRWIQVFERYCCYFSVFLNVIWMDEMDLNWLEYPFFENVSGKLLLILSKSFCIFNNCRKIWNQSI